MWALLFVVLGACQPERGPLEGLPRSVRSQVGKPTEVTPCLVASLPAPVRRALAKIAREPELRMADPGQEWNSTDRGRRGVPGKQLARVARSDTAWIVDYWKGGFASSYRVAVLGVEGDAVPVLWSGQCHNGRRGTGKWRCKEDAAPSGR